jgi:hypothetical protein
VGGTVTVNIVTDLPTGLHATDAVLPAAAAWPTESDHLAAREIVLADR